MKTQRPETAPTPRRIVDSSSYELQSPDEPCPAWWRRWCRARPAASSSPAPSQPPSTTAPCSTPPTRCCTPRRLTYSRCVGPRLSTARNCCKPLLFCDIIRQKIIKIWLRCQWGSAPRSSALAPVGYVKTFCHCTIVRGFSRHTFCANIKWTANCWTKLMKIMHRWKVISPFRLVQEKNSFVFTRLVIWKTGELSGKSCPRYCVKSIWEVKSSIRAIRDWTGGELAINREWIS